MTKKIRGNFCRPMYHDYYFSNMTCFLMLGWIFFCFGVCSSSSLYDNPNHCNNQVALAAFSSVQTRRQHDAVSVATRRRNRDLSTINSVKNDRMSSCSNNQCDDNDHSRKNNNKLSMKQDNTSVVKRRTWFRHLSSFVAGNAAANFYNIDNDDERWRNKFVLPSANAFPSGRQRAQIDYCLVNVLRLQYWVQRLISQLENTTEESTIKELFLEARLGCKAALTQKVGGGANINVYNLKSLKLKDCLDDSIEWYDNALKEEKQQQKKSKTKSTDSVTKRRSKRELQDVIEDIYYYLGSVVEFDGLESVTDPSPRSSLTLQMYNKDKAVFVKRTLKEKLLPNLQVYFTFFDRDLYEKCQLYVKQFYPSEYYNVNVNKQGDAASNNNPNSKNTTDANQ